MRRREFLGALGGAAVAWPLAARAQSIPVVGVLGAASPVPYITAAIADGLRENGYTEGRNVRIAYRWAAGAYDRLPGLADELVRLPADVIVTLGTPAARPAKAASIKVSPAVPMVFVLGADPVAEGLVASLNRPGGNVTGSTSIGGSLAPKRLEIIGAFLGRDVPAAILINPDNPLGGAERAEAEQAARAVGRPLVVLSARDRSEIEAAFAALKPRGAGALIIAVDTFYFAQMRWMAELAAAYKTPAIAALRDFTAAGGLMTYGPSIQDVTRQGFVYVGKVLKGAKPTDLPVMQPVRFELVINLKTAKALGLTMPDKLLVAADEVIE